MDSGWNLVGHLVFSKLLETKSFNFDLMTFIAEVSFDTFGKELGLFGVSFGNPVT